MRGGWIAATSLRYSTDKNITDFNTLFNDPSTKITPDNFKLISSYTKSTGSNFYKYTVTDGAYYWTTTTNASTYATHYYWACGPEQGMAVPTDLWSPTPEPNNSSGNENCTVASYNKNYLFNDYPPTQPVAGYFLEFSAYPAGLANENVHYKSTTIYKVTYNENGATGGTVPDTQAKFYQQPLTLATNSGNLEKTGSGDIGFNGWNTKADGNGDHYDAGGTYSANANLTLYAEWVTNPAKPPTVTGPEDISLDYGYDEGSGKLSVTAVAASGAEYDLSYQWYSNTTKSNEDGQLISGETKSSYTIPAGSKGLDVGEYYYYCIVTATKKDDASKKAATASDPATVTVGKGKGTIKFSENDPEEISKTFGDENFTKVVTKTGDGTVTYSSNKTDVATVNSETGEVTIVGAGDAIITATVADGEKYTYENNNTTYKLKVNKKSISPTISMSDYTYGGTLPQPGVTGNTGNGEVTYYYNTTQSREGAMPWNDSINSKTLDVGTYFMYADIAESTNYAAATTGEMAVFKVEPAEIELDALNYSDIYDGNSHGIRVTVTEPASGATIKYGLTEGTYDLDTNPTFKNVGATKTVYFEVTAPNYTAKTGSATVEISPKEVKVSGIQANDKTYDGNVNAQLKYDEVEFDGKLGADSLTVTAKGKFSDKNAAEGKTVVKISDISLGGDDAQNYVLAGSGQQTTTEASITPKTIGLTWADTELTYNGNEQTPTATATGLVEGDTCNVTVTGGQTDVGTYTAIASEVDNQNYALPTANTKEFKINPASMNVEGEDYEGVYDGGEHGISLTVNSPAETTITYRTEAEGEYDLTENPKYADVGTYTVYYKVTKDNYTPVTGSNTVKITKADLKDVSVSQAKDLMYNGEEQTVEVDAAATSVNDQPVTFKYSASEDGEFSDEVPAFKEAGEYTVYYIASAPNHNDASGTFTVKIKQADTNSVTVSMDDWTYGEEPNDPELTADFGADTAVFTYSDSEDGTFTDSLPTDAGTWYVKAVVPETTDYVGNEAVAEFKINKAVPEVTAPEAKTDLVFNKKDQELITEGSTNDGTMYYALGEDGAEVPEFDGLSEEGDKKWSTSIPSAKDVGKYVIWYMVIGDSNHLDTEPVAVNSEILEKLYNYFDVSGDGSSWTKGSSEDLPFVFKRTEDDEETFDHLKEVKVDGGVISPDSYTTERGSVIIKLKAAFLETLSVGDHTLTAVFNDGNDVTVNFKVLPAPEKSGRKSDKDSNAKKDIPKQTSDDTPIVIPVLVMLDSLAASVLILLLKRRYSF